MNLGTFRVLSRRRALSLAVAAGLSLGALAPGAGAAVISNTATATYHIGSAPVPQPRSSNTSTILTVPAPAPARIQFYQHAPGHTAAVPLIVGGGQYGNGAPGAFDPLPTATSYSGEVAAGSTVPALETGAYHAGDAMLVSVADANRNQDPALREFIEVTLTSSNGDVEVLRLQETGPDTGIFTAVVQIVRAAPSPQRNDGRLAVGVNARIEVQYQDPFYATDVAAAAALVDPFGVVFDSVTGLPLNGATVRMINADTGLPAAVFGDDGISAHPAVIVTGGTVTDSSGRVYPQEPGGFRFPFVQPGRYLLVVTPVGGYTVPSQVPPGSMPAAPGGGAYSVTVGSYGDVFAVNPGPALNIDIPADPPPDPLASLLLRKQASQAEVSAGDFLRYGLVLENRHATNAASSVVVTDVLPSGMRYRAGSLVVGGAAAPDPAIGADGRTLTIPVGTLAAGARLDLAYVVQVVSGTPRSEAVNRATAAAAGGEFSNTALAAVRIREPLMAAAATLIGRVIDSPCDAAPEAQTGVANVRLLLEDGTYVTTDSDGLYHFEGVRPGTHVVQVDLDSLPPHYEAVSCLENTRFGGTPYSQFVDVRGGSLWRADFFVRARPREAGLRLRTVAAGTATRPATHEVEADGQPAAKNLRLSVLLPPGLRYVPGSARVDGATVADPDAVEGVHTFLLGEAPADWTRRLVFQTQPPPAAPAERLALHFKFDSGRAELTADGEQAVQALLDGLGGRRIERIEVIGHTDSVRVRPGRFRDNHDLSRARAGTVAQRLAAGLGLAPDQVTAAGRGPDEPVASNATPAGRALNRRTEVILHETAAPAAACAEGDNEIRAVLAFDSARGAARTPPAGLRVPCGDDTAPAAAGNRVTVSLTGSREKELPENLQAALRKRQQIPDAVAAAGGSTDWLAAATPGIDWMFPPADHNPRAPALRVVIRHAPGQTVVLRRDGEPVSPLNFDDTRTNADGSAAISVWRGIALADGANRLQATVLDADGTAVTSLERVVYYANTPVRAELVPEQSLLVADGVHKPVIAVRLLDREGRPVRAGVSTSLDLAAPYVPWESVARQQERQLAGLDRFQPQLTVEGDDGIAYVELQPTTEAGTAVLTLQFQIGTGQTRRQELRAWLASAPRDWVVVGFAEGTAGYNTLKQRATPLPPGVDKGAYTEGQVSLYAKGQVRGEWLLTMAYDGGKPDADARRRSLLSTIDPGEFYTLYGDGTAQRYDAASQEKLYLKLERGQFYALFGDYNTGLTVTQLSRYNRTLNGVKSELDTGTLSYTAFAAETPQHYARDEIRGDGTSGLYRLSRRGIVINSETLRLETRDRYRSEQVLESRGLQRHLDYDIDYTEGTLFFRAPVLSHDAAFNPIFIVAEYETLGPASDELTAGGRVGVKLLEGRLSAGLSYLREEQFGADADLAGADLKLQVGPSSELRVETARSDGELNAVAREGSAWLAEFEHHGQRFDGLLYLREQEPGFGLNQQSAAEAGTRKAGADAQVRLDEHLALQGQAYRHENLAGGATRDVGSTQLRYQSELSTLSAGYQVAQDQAPGGARFDSQQVLLAASRRLFDQRLELHANSDIGVGSGDGSVDYPSRHQVGAAYALSQSARLVLTQEYTDGAMLDTMMTRVGVQVSPWAGARLDTTLNQGQIDEYGPRTFAQFGLTQAILLGERWGVDLAFDSSRTFNESGQVPLVVNPNQPAAITGGSLTEDFVAVSGGLTYRAELWSWNGRLETRNGSSSERDGFTTAFLRQARAGIAFSASAQFFRAERSTGTRGLNGSAGLGWAWRPLGHRWSVLDRLEFRYDALDNGVAAETDGGLFGHNSLNFAGDAVSRRLVNNLAVNRVGAPWTAEDRRGDLFRGGQRNQWSLYYGAKYAFDRFNGVPFRGYTDLTGVEVRHDLTPRWDIGLQAAALHLWDAHVWEYSVGPSVGWSPVTDGWVSFGYNLRGFHDRDFEAARYTAQGPFLKLRFKFDQNTRWRRPGDAATPAAALSP